MIVTKEEMKKLEKESGYSTEQLIDCVAEGCFSALSRMIFKSDRTIILCGSGNNGQDGLAIAERLKKENYCFKIVLHSTKPVDYSRYTLDENDFISQEIFENTIGEYDILLDCVFGFSFHLPLKEETKQLFRLINNSPLRVYSIDINSGLQADDGEADYDTLRSECTLVLGAYKPCHLFYKNNLLARRTILIPLPINQVQNSYYEMDHDKLQAMLPEKAPNSHKGKNGRLLVYAGSYGLAGAATLAGLSALHTGVSYMHLLIDPNIYPIVGKHILSGVYHFTDENTPSEFLNQIDAVITGPGCNNLIEYKKHFRELLCTAECPIVVDAFGLRVLAEDMSILNQTKAQLILTPHLGEFSALINQPITAFNANPLKFAREFVNRYNCTLVLKGPNTIVIDKEHLYVNQSGNFRLAKAASGDCLSGIISSFAAQHKTPFEAAMMGVYVHGLCADLTDQSLYTFTPEDIPEMLQRIL